ncbi:MAG: hypothetical protein RTU63_05910 [Candidatus Thorarchaeota archaeon]
MTFCPTNDTIVTYYNTGSLNFFRLSDGKLIRSTESLLKEGEEELSTVAFSPDGKHLAAIIRVDYGHTRMELRRFPDLSVVWEIEGRDFSAWMPLSLCFSPDSSSLAVGCCEGTIRILDVIAATVKSAKLEKSPKKSTSDEMKEDEERVLVLRDLGREQAQFVFKVKVQNQSEFLVSKVKVVLMDYPSDLLLLQGSDKRSIDQLPPSSFETVTYRFDVKDERCVGRDIHADVSFYDYKGTRHIVSVRPVTVKHVCDLLKPEEIKPEEFQALYTGLEKTSMPLSLLTSIDDTDIEELISALDDSNLYTLPIVRAGTSIVVQAHGRGKTTGVHAAAVILLPTNPSEPMTLEFGSEQGRMTTHGIDEIQRIMEKLCFIERKIDYVLSNSERLMTAAGESKETSDEIRSKLIELGDKTDSTSQLAKEILAITGEKLNQVSMGQQTLNQAVEDVLERIEGISSKLGIERSRIDEVKDAIQNGAKSLAKTGIGDILWNMAKMGLIALGIPIPL